MDDRFIHPNYIESRKKRIKAMIDHYGVDFFNGARFLEVGAGYGHIGNEFATKYGSDVVCTEGRPENVEGIKQLFPHIESHIHDLEQPWPFDEKFDFILHTGVLHHINPNHTDQAIKDICDGAHHSVLELEVADVPDPYYNRSEAERGGGHLNSAYQGVGARPSYAYIERILDELEMQYEMHTDPAINGPAQFTWQPGHAPVGPRKLWYIWK